jgi:hypothetical protein
MAPIIGGISTRVGKSRKGWQSIEECTVGAYNHGTYVTSLSRPIETNV